MMERMILPLMAFWPLAAAFLSFLTGRRSKSLRDAFVNAATLVELVLAVYALCFVLRGGTADWYREGFCAMGLHLRLDGFRAVYVLIAAVMWFATGLFSREYFAEHYRNRNRYYFFTLMTMCGTVGLFLSASLYSAFIFFEIMSMASYAWVAHDEKPAAMRAAQTYLAVAVIGGMATLMGLFLLYDRIGTLEIDGIRAAVEAETDRSGLYLIGALIASGFAAKAGAFPLHIWLPKAHPVAPAPSSALLSGILTKGGVFGIIAVSCNIFFEDAAWGNAVLVVGVITMFAGAVLALISIDLKRTLACSSMSQIGFILIGIGTRCLLREEGGLAASGALMHMVNHSLIKLCLFMCAGSVYMRLHKLDLNAVRGFGRGRIGLQIAFTLGAAGIMGIPLGNGYISKSLLHEGILEYAAMAPAGLYVRYKAAEWIFLLSGGLTAAYMTKLYVCLFVERNADEQEQRRFGSLPRFRVCTNCVLVASGVLLLVLGVLPEVFLQKAASLSMGFFGTEMPGHIAYFSWENLKGAAISLGIGAAVYFGIVRTCLMRKNADGSTEYVDRKPPWLDMENMLYRPLLEKLLPWIGGTAAKLGDVLFTFTLEKILKPVAYVLTSAADNIYEFILHRIVKPVVYLCTRAADEAADSGALLLLETVFHHKQQSSMIVGSRGTNALGRFLNGCASVLNHTVLRRRPITTDFIPLLAAGRDEMNDTLRRITRSVSFGLLLVCVCMYIIFAYLLKR